jgi:hypothetical protein
VKVRFIFRAPDGRIHRTRTRTWFAGRALAVRALGCEPGQLQHEAVDLGGFKPAPSDPTRFKRAR